MIKLFIAPHYRNEDSGDGGIRRVTDAMWKYLPQFGVQPTDNPDEADVINNHGAMLVERPGVPMIASCHGLYWHDYDWPSWAHETNRMVIETMRRADAITAPSKWVANAITRGMLVKPHVIYHGVEIDEFEPDPDPADWVLWNKARIDLVSNPEYVYNVAKIASDIRFVVTIESKYPIARKLSELSNVKIVDPMPYEIMKKYVAKAGVYLCTTRETFGIGTLEAMACGVPVVGFAYGGQTEIIKQGETGYLVPFGEYEKLAEALRLAIKNRGRIGANARQDIANRWEWKDKIGQYADIVQSVYTTSHKQRLSETKVSIIVTCYNLADYLGACLDSIKQQTYSNYECIVVDDCSDDERAEIICRNWGGKKVKYFRTPKNLGLCGALNYGIQRTNIRTRYIINLDADNLLPPNAIKTLVDALDSDRSIHIAYGHLDLISEDGTNQSRSKDFPPAQFNWRGQMAHLNQIHSSAMYRREVWENLGGYRIRNKRNEDASFWARATSFGYRAKKVTEESTVVYRMRSDSKSANEHKSGGEANWVAWLPWRLADNARDGVALRLGFTSEIPTAPIVPFGSIGSPPQSWNKKRQYWNVRHHQKPLISVIIPVGKGHKKYLIDALDSLIAQDFQDWEVIVVNDTGDDWEEIAGAPYAKVVRTQGMQGAGVARNLGATHARGFALLWLDSDDYLLPGALRDMWAQFGINTVVYGDWLASVPNQELSYYGSFDFETDRHHKHNVLRRPIHPVTALVPYEAHFAIGGFDETMPAWEDWDYQIKLYAVLGACGIRLPQATMVYRQSTGRRRRVASPNEVKNKEAIRANNDKLRQILYDRYREYYKGIKEMASRNCRKCGSKPPPSTFKQEAINRSVEDGNMILEFTGGGIGNFDVKMTNPNTGVQWRGRVTRTQGKMLLYNVPPVIAELLKSRTRRGVPQYVDYQEPQPQDTVKAPVDAQQWAMPEIEMEESAFENPGQMPSSLDSIQQIAKLTVSIANMSISDIEDLIPDATEDDLVSWLSEEKAKGKKARKTLVGKLTKALNEL